MSEIVVQSLTSPAAGEERFDKSKAEEFAHRSTSEATHRAVDKLKDEGMLPVQTVVRTNKYLNNLIEQDNWRIKQRYYPMLGFKKFENAKVTLSGIELAAKIKKGQYDTSAIAGTEASIPQIWEAVIAA